MLDPRGRQLLLTSLRPPGGFRFDCAVATTYSLDLIALLTAPLAFAMFDWQCDDGTLTADPATPTADPLALLESLRRCADRIHIYCQAGQIKVPPANQRLLAYLEQAVIEVQPPSARTGGEGVFHPKLWALRFVDARGGPDVRYRLLCLSRNLTFDRSWDTVLLLDGQLTERQRGFPENRPLADFFAKLPDLVVRPDALAEAARSDMRKVSQELLTVKWELPEGVDEVRFWPMGFENKKSWPFPDRIDRLLVVSPFVTAGFITKIGLAGREQHLVSRQETLRELDPQSLRNNWNCFTLDDACVTTNPLEVAEATDSPAPAETLSGLHAKLFVADIGHHAHVWTGSANATTAAFTSNVEFLVEMIGTRGKLGTQATIGDAPKLANLRPLLTPFTPNDKACVPDADLKAAESLVNSIRREISQLAIRIKIEPAEGGFPGFTSTVASESALSIHNGATVVCRPIMLAKATALGLANGECIAAVFGPHAADTISSFVSFDVTAKVREAQRTEHFVLNLPMDGAPTDRRDRVLRDLLRDPETLLRFLLLLLSDDPEQLFEELRTRLQSGSQPSSNHRDSWIPLLEHMLAALHQCPEKLDHVYRLVEDLKKTPEGQAILPPELEQLWEPISKARKTLLSQKARKQK